MRVCIVRDNPARAVTKAMAYCITQTAKPRQKKILRVRPPLAKRSPRYLTNSFHPPPNPDKENKTSHPTTTTAQKTPNPTKETSQNQGGKDQTTQPQGK